MKVLIGTKWRDEGMYVLEMVFKANGSMDKIRLQIESLQGRLDEFMQTELEEI
ncbi:hypothetical protein [Advenella kashmirensis]|nr:hypothetical protein [Advenella kashmirensis]